MIYRFADCALDDSQRELRRAGQNVPIEPQVFDLLLLLVRRPDTLVLRSDLVDAVWGGRFISDATIDSRIATARRAIGDSGSEQALIRTVPRRGFRFVATVSVDPSADPNPRPPLPDKPSIAVLPFQNMSGDPEQEYFADGMVEEIITALSRFKELFVIARNSSFTYKGRIVDVKQVGRELGVRYVLEGSVRKASERVRITGQLIEAATGAHLWADRFDGTLEDIFDLQDKITVQVVGAIAGLGGPVERAEIERARQKRLVNQTAYDWYLKGNEQCYIPTREAQTKALEMFQRAIEVDPCFAAAYAGAIQPYSVRLIYGWISDRNELSEALRLARKAIELDPEDPYVLMRSGYSLATYGGEYDRGRAFAEKAVQLNPNLAWAQMICGHCRIANGEYRESIGNIEAFMRLSPLGPYSFLGPHALAQAYFFLDKPAECRQFAELAIRAAPEVMVIRHLDILSLVAVNRIDEAKEKLITFAKDYPGLANATGLRRRSMYSYYRDIEKAVRAFRVAGLSD